MSDTSPQKRRPSNDLENKLQAKNRKEPTVSDPPKDEPYVMIKWGTSPSGWTRDNATGSLNVKAIHVWNIRSAN
jgi:hypothetical protein